MTVPIIDNEDGVVWKKICSNTVANTICASLGLALYAIETINEVTPLSVHRNGAPASRLALESEG